MDRASTRSYRQPTLMKGRPVVLRNCSVTEVLPGTPIYGEEDGESRDFQQLLMIELGHRLSNVFSMVLAVTRQTLDTATSLSAAAEALEKRLSSMAGAHRLLLEGKTETTQVKDVVDRALEPFALQQSAVRIFGPAVDLNPRDALGLSLVLHELATNAIKHGALSVASGFVEIAWVVSGSGERCVCSLRWHEHDGPVVNTPTRLGSGSKLIRRALGARATVEVDFDRCGLKFTATFPATNRSEI